MKKLIYFWIAVFLLNSLNPLQARPRRKRYKAARGKYPPMVVVPFKSASLSPPICRMLNQSLMDELKKSAPYKVLNRPGGQTLEEILGSNVDQIDVYKLKKYARTRMLLMPTIEKKDQTFSVNVKFYDLKHLNMPLNYQQKCDCPFEEIIFWVIPDLVDKMRKLKLTLDPHCPNGMVTIASGSFTMGSDYPYDNNEKMNQKHGNFCIDAYEYPNRMGEMPLAEVSWTTAQKKCEMQGKRLCTEIEWERACRGKFNFIYPYGNNYYKKKCVTNKGKPKKIGSNVDCHSGELVYDMSGNVNEWTGDNWDANLANKVIRGGGHKADKRNSRCTLRYSNAPETISIAIGFRCCKSIP